MQNSRCDRCRAELEADDLRCPVCALTIASRAPSAPGSAPRVQASVVRCQTCRAALAWSAEAQAPKCAYCGSVTKLEAQDDPLEQARHFVPFAVDAERARQALRDWLASKRWFRPSDLASAASFDSLKAIRWPAWVFDADALVSWTADSNAGSHKASWAPHAGESAISFRDILIPASKGLTEAECRALAPAYALRAAREAPIGDPAGTVVEQFEARRSGARQLVADELTARARQEVTHGHVPGSRHRNVKVAALVQGLSTRRFALPAYVLAYRYRKALYRVVVHGQDPACVLGDAPWSVWKILGAIVGGVALVAGIAALLAVLGNVR